MPCKQQAESREKGSKKIDVGFRKSKNRHLRQNSFSREQFLKISRRCQLSRRIRRTKALSAGGAEPGELPLLPWRPGQVKETSFVHGAAV